MMIIVALVTFFVSAFEANAFRETAPDDLSPRMAVEHLAAARIAAAVYDVDAADLLAIAHHESRYNPTAVTREPTGYSCGVMTPYDVARDRCPRWMLTTLGGYLAGARHLAMDWGPPCRRARLCMLRGYSGNARDRQQPGARAWVRFNARAARIRRAISEAR